MNNKGFAITSIIYGLMLLFVLVITSFLSILVGRNRRIDELVNSIYEDISYKAIEVKTTDFENENNSYVTEKRGLYYFEPNKCYVYLPKNVVLVTGAFKDSDKSQINEIYYNVGGDEKLEEYINIESLCLK